MNIEIGQPLSFNQLGKRANQEDCRFPDDDRPRKYAPFFIVCDGVGGCAKGEVASRLVCEAFSKALAGTDWKQEFTDEDFSAALGQAFDSIGKAATGDRKDMATTLTFVAFHAGGCLAAHVGDSRIYHIRPGAGILYRSNDHSLVNALVHSGNLSPEDADGHPDGNIITRYIGAVSKGGERSQATVMHIDDLEAGDYLFLCSDGVLENIDDRRLAGILSGKASDEQKIATLAALSRESHDNNTAYLVPIASVTKGAGDEPEETAGHTDNSTCKLHTGTRQAQEVASASRPTISRQIHTFFKKLFEK